MLGKYLYIIIKTTNINLSFQVICSGLHLLGGNAFLSFEGVANHSSKATAYCHLDELTRKCIAIKPRFMHMSMLDHMEENARVIWNKYALKNVIGGIDGMMIPMTNLRSLPPGHDQVLYFNRRAYRALNCLQITTMKYMTWL